MKMSVMCMVVFGSVFFENMYGVDGEAAACDAQEELSLAGAVCRVSKEVGVRDAAAAFVAVTIGDQEPCPGLCEELIGEKQEPCPVRGAHTHFQLSREGTMLCDLPGVKYTVVTEMNEDGSSKKENIFWGVSPEGLEVFKLTLAVTHKNFTVQLAKSKVKENELRLEGAKNNVEALTHEVALKKEKKERANQMQLLLIEKQRLLEELKRSAGLLEEKVLATKQLDDLKQRCEIEKREKNDAINILETERLQRRVVAELEKKFTHRKTMQERKERQELEVLVALLTQEKNEILAQCAKCKVKDQAKPEAAEETHGDDDEWLTVAAQ